ncbi:MAG: methionyl-tRNA formyltransferase [Bacilli bacterium]|nr:methionyl-tRNA formyltransferase [Bacilli bacterium]
MKDLKVVFMGTPDFSIPILEVLIENCNVIGVVTQPDKIVGRDKSISFTPIKKVAMEHNILVLQPNQIKVEYQEVIDLKPDMIVTCAYGQIIPQVLLDFPKYKCINVHASLLPNLRGGAPIHHALIDGYTKTGVTIMYMDKGMDSGDIISTMETKIEESDNLETLHDRLSRMGAELLIKTLPSIIDGTNKRIKQDEKLVTYGFNIKREEELIDFSKNKREIFNKIRGLNPVPGAYAILNNKTIKFYETKTLDDMSYSDKENGTIVKLNKDGLFIKVKDGIIVAIEIKLEGKKKMKVKDFINGNKEDLVGIVLNKGENRE